MKLSELLTINNSLKDKLTKIDELVVQKFADLQAAVDKLTQQLSDVELTDEQTASVTELQTVVQSLDDLVEPPVA